MPRLRKHESAPRLAMMAKATNLPLRGLFLSTDLTTDQPASAPARDASDADEKVARRQESYDLGPLDWTQIDASGTPEDTSSRALAALD